MNKNRKIKETEDAKMKKILMLLFSLMLVNSMLVWGEELDNKIESPANTITLPVGPQEPQDAELKAGEPINQPQKPEEMEQPTYQPQLIGTPNKPQIGNPGQPQDNFNKDKPMPPNVGNQQGKYPQPPQGKPFNGKDGNQQEQPPLLNEKDMPKEQDTQEQPIEIPETDGSWVPLKKIGNFFYFWKPKDAPKEEQTGEMQKKTPQNVGNTKNVPPFQQGKFQDGAEQNELGEDNQNVGHREGTGDKDFQDTYEKDKANTKVDVKSFKNPGEADTTFEKMFKEGNMETVLIKNMKLVKRVTGGMDEYLWPAHDKILSLSVPKGDSLEQNLFVFEYLSKYPSKLNPNSDTLGLPGEGMNLPLLKETPQFKEKESKEGPSGDFPKMQVGIPNGTNNENGQQQQFTPQAPPGCKVGDKGVPTGFRLLNEGSSQYCDMDEQLHPQKALDESCQNNFECQSNQCSSGKCLDLNAKMEETQNLLQKILVWLGMKKE